MTQSIATDTSSNLRMTTEEAQSYDRDGYLLRENVLSPTEVARLRDVAEEVITTVTSEKGAELLLLGGRRFELGRGTAIQWEWAEGSKEVRLIEPCTHLHPELLALWDDPRFAQPARDALAADEVGPYTCKLNMKRPREGSPFPWHQDFPYWYAFTPKLAHRIVTEFIFLDDATAENGALRVLPGSHKNGPIPRDKNAEDKHCADASLIDESMERVVEAPAGSLLFFGTFLVHRSTPNRSDAQRRALLLSYQPGGNPRRELASWQPELVDELP